MSDDNIKAGDVVQIDPSHEGFFRGCFMLVTEVKSWGVQGFISMPRSRDEIPGRAYYRCPFDKLVRIGRAEWIPSDDDTPETP